MCLHEVVLLTEFVLKVRLVYFLMEYVSRIIWPVQKKL
jgi:hypothetical protein